MRPGEPIIPDGVRARVLQLGQEAVDWLDSVPALLARAAARWELDLGYVVDVPTAAVVVRARRGDVPVVLKLRPGRERFAAERAILTAARGEGYVRLLDADGPDAALLLEALGPTVDIDEVEAAGALAATRVFTATLRRAWSVPVDTVAASPVHPAQELLDVIDSSGVPVDIADARRAIDRARAYAQQRLDADDPSRHVICHGDPHLGNLRTLFGERPGAESGYVLVDPHGVRAEPEYDLGVVIRDANRALLGAEDVVVRARDWCARLADDTGGDAEAVWQWGFLQRVAWGLALVNGPAPLSGRLYLQTATALVSRPRA